MKKQFIAKLVVLCLALAMLPTAAFAAIEWGENAPDNNANATKIGDIYYWNTEDVLYWNTADTNPVSTPDSMVDVEDVTVEGGMVSIEAKVVNGTATVSLSDAVVEKLADEVKDGEIVLNVKAEGATKLNVSVSAKALTELAEKTGADLTIKSDVANITIPNSVLTSELGTTGTVRISVQAAKNSVSFSIQVDGKALKGVKGVKVEF